MKRILLILSAILTLSTSFAFAADNNLASNGVMSTEDIMELLKPVGSYVETYDASFNPNTAWGGTWVKETEGLVHVSSGSGYAVSGANANNGAGTQDGGRLDAVIVSHYHSVDGQTVNTGGISSQHQHFVVYRADVYKPSSGTAHQNVTWDNGSRAGTQGTSGITANHTHGASVGAWNTGSTGTSNTSNANLMPYRCVIVWHRTA